MMTVWYWYCRTLNQVRNCWLGTRRHRWGNVKESVDLPVMVRDSVGSLRLLQPHIICLNVA